MVENAIDRNPLTISVEASVASAIAAMERAGASCILVVERERFVSTFTSGDVVKLAASGRLTAELKIAQVTNRSAIVLSRDEVSDIFSLLELFDRHRLNCLPILTADGRVFGLVTASTLFAALPADLLSQVERQAAQLTQLNQQIDSYQDLAVEKEANEQALQVSHERLDRILSSIEDVVWSIDPNTLQLYYLNAATEKVFGRQVNEFIANPNLWQEIIHPDDRELVEKANQVLYATCKQDIEFRILTSRGEVRWIRVRARAIADEDGNLRRIDGITTDITQLKRVQEQLQYDALHDGLTGLANRNLLMDRLHHAIKRHQRQSNKFFALLFLDLDRFKVINDSLGHFLGDELLKAVARRLEQSQRAEDTVARLGGDEFVILLEELVDVEGAIVVARRIHEALKPAIMLDRHEVFVSASIGIATGSFQTHTSPEQVVEILRNADTAMYRAKARGQGYYEVFDPSMHAHILERLRLENDLRRAIAFLESGASDRQEFVVYYQPIVSLSSRQIHGFEALLRWQHPERGLIPPIEFIPIAEEAGIIVSLDRWVLRTACQQLRVWEQQFPTLLPLTMSVNLSGNHFSQAGLIEFIDEILQETNLNGGALKLEITESVLIQNTEAAAATLRKLKSRNIHVHLDDFGTGYSSLSYLHCFPFNALKIDRSFVKQLGVKIESEENSEIIKAIINLGLTLRMNVIAEGVETKEQLLQLKSLSCPYGQGYLFSEPIASDAVTAFLGASEFK
ncbi:MAG: EAL domain-containing protein [Cyanosarcina radialis HA8281-LM2]|jgi:diguanylate cyclase (GGDEF)-like protein/PAS domain S-box-containing protein|nr:EAL domain-containing protein [Cyanosarcina radialis HA8281-LM2]